MRDAVDPSANVREFAFERRYRPSLLFRPAKAAMLACAEKSDLRGGRRICGSWEWMWARAARGPWWWTRTGRLISGASSEHAPFRTAHPGWAEQDPEDWWRAAQEAIRFALAAAPEPHEPIAAIGLTGQMHGAVLLDENGQVLRPSLIWCDTRTQPECDWLNEKIGYERLIELTCNPGVAEFHADEAAVGQDARAGDFRQDAPCDVPQGLCALPVDRGICD